MKRPPVRRRGRQPTSRAKTIRPGVRNTPQGQTIRRLSTDSVSPVNRTTNHLDEAARLYELEQELGTGPGNPWNRTVGRIRKYRDRRG